MAKEKKSSWIKEYKKENIDNVISDLTDNIENNFYLLGKELSKLKEQNITLTSYEKYGINEKKAKQLISNYEFCLKHNIEKNIQYNKLTLLTKLSSHPKIKEFIEDSYTGSFKELEDKIFGKKEDKILTKQFKLDQDTVFLFEKCKKIIDKTLEKNTNQNDVFSYLLMEFYSSNIRLLDD